MVRTTRGFWEEGKWAVWMKDEWNSRKKTYLKLLELHPYYHKVYGRIILNIVLKYYVEEGVEVIMSTVWLLKADSNFWKDRKICAKARTEAGELFSV